MPRVARLLLVAMLLGIAAFCVFGFLATFEPTPRDVLPWQVGYGATAFVAVLGAGFLAWPIRPRD
ncbi:MAG: hypothetical protein JNJ77_14295 [Planctomycetia bacterium]|nr:hypothetical protein [Planctomycetia bacterium]